MLRFLRVIGTAHVPGLLQTEDYARAVFAYGSRSFRRASWSAG